MISTVVAVAGAVAAAWVTGWLTLRAAAGTRAHEVRESRRIEQIAAVTELAAALADLRRAMWVRMEAEIGGRDAARVDALRNEVYRVRSLVTAPLVRVRLLVPALAAVATTAAQSTYDLRDARDHAELTARRAAAMTAYDDLIATMATRLTPAPT